MWNKCTIFFLTFLSYFPLHSHFLFHDQHVNAAQSWIAQYLIDADDTLLVTPHDLQLVINFFYCAYNRSQANIQAQDAAMPLLRTSWQLWRNIAQRRRNPAIALPYAEAHKNLLPIAQNAADCMVTHDAMASSYATINELIFKENALENKLLLPHLQALKDESRSLITQALIDVQSHITDLISYMQKRSPAYDEPEMTDELMTRSSLFDYLKQHMPIWAFQSFNKTDILFLKSSTQNWQMLITCQELSNLIWRAIEIARGSLYYNYYVVLFDRMQSIGIEPIIKSSQAARID